MKRTNFIVRTNAEYIAECSILHDEAEHLIYWFQSLDPHINHLSMNDLKELKKRFPDGVEGEDGNVEQFCNFLSLTAELIQIRIENNDKQGLKSAIEKAVNIVKRQYGGAMKIMLEALKRYEALNK